MSFSDVTEQYSISFDGGDAVFSWGISEITFTLNPEPLIAVGVDPEKVKGWDYVQATVEINGESGQVWRFQKAIDLKQ